jgi:hypothetical protein
MILLCQDEMPGRIILMYLNKLLCTIQQKNYIVNCKLKVSSSNNNLLELQHLNSVDLFKYIKITRLPIFTVNSPKTHVHEVGKVQFEYQTPCTKSKVS